MHLLEQKIITLIGVSSGVWGIVVEDLNSGNRFSMNENERFQAASIIKLPIMAAVFACAEEKKLQLSDHVTFRLDDLAGGSGILQHLSPGLSLTIYDLITLMIIQSDNTATNMLIDLVGEAKINQTIFDLGLTNSVFCNKTGLFKAEPNGQNEVTAKDAAILLKKLATGAYLSQHACKQMVDIMKKQQIRNGLPNEFPQQSGLFIGQIPEWQIANKTGWNAGIQHDVGLLYVKQQTLIVSILSKDTESSHVAWSTIAKIGKEVYRYGSNLDESAST